MRANNTPATLPYAICSRGIRGWEESPLPPFKKMNNAKRRLITIVFGAAGFQRNALTHYLIKRESEIREERFLRFDCLIKSIVTYS